MAVTEITGRKILSYGDLPAKGIRFSRQWIACLIKAGKFPRPIHLGEATVGFLEHEIEAWIDERVRKRDKVA